MDTKVVVAAVGGVVVLAGGALVLARMGDDSAPLVADAAGTGDAVAEPVIVESDLASPPAIVLDEREVSEDASPQADGRNDQRGFQRDGGRFGGNRDWRAEMLERFDADGDGELSEEERQKARETMRAEREERRQQFLLERYDKDGDGVLNEEETRAMEEDQARMEAEREARREQMRQRALEMYDTDRDGQLSEAERDAANELRRAWFQEQRQQAMVRFDADGDGELSIDEMTLLRETMRRAFQDMRFTEQFDADGDGAVTSSDMQNYLDLFYAGDMSADVNRDGVVDEVDLADFQARVLEGPNPDVQRIREAFESAPPPVDGEDGFRGRSRGGGPGGGFGGRGPARD
ncbi:MAG: hypothetical protein D6695_07065 [Planctomycetota bacterium]|nr:MAG: hypothetical protein D6695_07065 [Planctomycetota bacterium]